MMTLAQARCLNRYDPVVMVDDSEIDIDLARRIYMHSSLENPFLAFRGGDEFLEYMDEVKYGQSPMPSLVLLDINMPGTSGFDTLKALRGQEAFMEFPAIIMLTNSDSARDKDRAYALGANSFRTKRYVIEEFVAFFDSLRAE